MKAYNNIVKFYLVPDQTFRLVIPGSGLNIVLSKRAWNRRKQAEQEYLNYLREKESLA